MDVSEVQALQGTAQWARAVRILQENTEGKNARAIAEHIGKFLVQDRRELGESERLGSKRQGGALGYSGPKSARPDREDK